MSFPPVLTKNSSFPTSQNVSSNFNDNQVITREQTNEKACQIALAILTGLGAVLGATALALGTFASAGTLPLAALFIITVIFGIASIAFSYQAAKGGQLTGQERCESIELDGEPLSFEQVSEQSSVKLPTGFVDSSEIERYGDLCAFIDDGNKEIGREYHNGIHPHFARDCVRDRLNISIDGKPVSELFSNECAQLVTLEQARSSLQEQANETNDEMVQEQADKAEEALDLCRIDLSKKMMGELTRVVTEKLGEGSPLLAPISASLCQDMGILLKNKVQKLSLDQYKGELVLRGTDPKIPYTYALAFPTDGSSAAKIEIEAAGQFHSITLAEETIPRALADSCLSFGSASISIAHTGEVEINSYVSLIS